MNEIIPFRKQYKAALIRAYAREKITQEELARWSSIKIPGAVFAKAKSKFEKEVLEFARKIGFKVLEITFEK